MPNFLNGIFARKGASKPSAVNIRRSCYTMTMTDDLDAEIQFYGEIVETRPIDWWTGEPVPGNFITRSEFLEDMESIAGAKTLLMRIDSIGGDSEVSLLIHNRLRELPAEKTARIDGVAMSGGTHIACAADHIQINPASQFMIHKCWAFFWGGFNADELRKAADGLDPTDKSQVAIYKARTGKTDEELLAMMSKTTTMVGQEIIDNGFADEMLDAAYEKPEIAASADGRLLMVNGRSMHMPPFAKLPEGIKTVKSAQAVETNTNQPATSGGQEGGKIMANNLEELRVENAELANQLMTEAKAAASAEAGASAVAEERKRIEEIDSIASLYDDDTVKDAKYGKNACTAQEMAFRAAQNAAKKGKKFLNDAQEDFQASGADDVESVPGDEEADKPLTPEQRMAAGRADAKKIQNKEEK